MIAVAAFVSANRAQDRSEPTSDARRPDRAQAPPRPPRHGEALRSTVAAAGAAPRLSLQEHSAAAAAKPDVPPRQRSLFVPGYEPEYDTDDQREAELYRAVILDSPDAGERETAVFLLSGNEHPQAIETFVEALDDRDADVRLAAVEALDDQIDDLDPTVLSTALDDPDPEVRTAALEALGELDDPVAYTMINDALADPDEDVRELAESLLPGQ